MKYWLFQNNQVLGPYDRDELAGSGGFSSESLVCPEGRKGTQMGDWQRAGVLTELADTLLRLARVPTGAAVGGISSFLPPEPTLRDLAVLGTLQEKVSLLENSLSSLHEELRAREDEISGLRVELSRKGSEAADMQAKVGDLEVKLARTESLREDIVKAQKAQEGGARTVEDLRAQVDSMRADLQSTVGRMEENQERLRSDLSSGVLSPGVKPSSARASFSPSPPPSTARPAAAPSSMPDPIPFAMPDMAPPGGLEPPSLEAGGFPPLELGGATPSPVPLDSPPAFDLNAPFEAPPGTPPSFDANIAPDFPQPGMELPKTGFGNYPTPLPAIGGMPEPLFGPETPGIGGRPSTEAPVDLMSPQAKPKRSKKALAALGVLILLGGGLGAAYQNGALNPVLKHFGLLKVSAKPMPEPPVTAPEPEPVPPPDTAQGLPDQTQAALEFAKAYPIPRLGKALAAVLESVGSGTGLVSPWNVKPSGEGRWEVSFYGKPGRLDYSYEVRLEAKEVRGLNAKSQAILDGKAPAPAKPEAAPAASPKKRKGRYTSKSSEAPPKGESSPLSDDPLGALLMESSSPDETPAEPPPARPRRGRRSAVVQKPLEELAEEPLALDPPANPEEPSQEEAKPRRKSAGAKTKEELTLDELLLPGVPKQR